MRLDDRETFPSGMVNYLSFYGWHFSKKMCEWASSNMYRIEGGEKKYIEPYTKDSLDALFKQQGMTLDGGITYDAVYLANMTKADFLKSSIRNESLLAMHVKDIIEDPDGYEGLPFTRFYADCVGSGTPIDWEDML